MTILEASTIHRLSSMDPCHECALTALKWTEERKQYFDTSTLANQDPYFQGGWAFRLSDVLSNFDGGIIPSKPTNLPDTTNTNT
jgi:hypothetical protein